jgi:hypothetical protein
MTTQRIDLASIRTDGKTQTRAGDLDQAAHLVPLVHPSIRHLVAVHAPQQKARGGRRNH